LSTSSNHSQSEVLHPEEIITKFLLIRHGDTQATERGLLYTDPKAELTDRGRAQAETIGLWMTKLKPDVIVTSAAKRVVDTARTISRELGLEPVLCQSLSEWHVGRWEGRSYLDIKRNDPEDYERWSSDPIRNRPPGGESIIDLRDRTDAQIKKLAGTYAGSTVALVTHAGIIRSILVTALEMPIDNFWRLSIPVASVSRVDLSKSFATVQFMSLRPSEL
jgi:broad specificity phosphatase PhoE